MSELASESVYLAIFDDIRMQRLLPNFIVQEEDLAARFNVSRTPVREAMRRLVQEGLLERRGTSTSVRQLSVDEVANIYPMIAVMEGLAAYLAATRITADELRMLETLHHRMVVQQKDAPSDFVESNQVFHDTIITAARNPALAKEIERFRMITNHFRQVVLGITQRQSQSVQEHAELLTALQVRDSVRAEQAMRTHVKTAEDLLMVVLRAGQLVAGNITSDTASSQRLSEPRRSKPAKAKANTKGLV